MVMTNADGKCSYCDYLVEGSGGCTRKECLDTRMKKATRQSRKDNTASNQEVVRHVFVVN